MAALITLIIEEKNFTIITTLMMQNIINLVVHQMNKMAIVL
jgi:hypothetical protein